MNIDVAYTIVDEPSSVVTGTGSPVTTAPEQVAYLYNTFQSKGTDSINDTYEITIDFGAVTIIRSGFVSSVEAFMTAQQPLTFEGRLRFEVGKSP